jgi:hypothetical protein
MFPAWIWFTPHGIMAAKIFLVVEAMHKARGCKKRRASALLFTVSLRD